MQATEIKPTDRLLARTAVNNSHSGVIWPRLGHELDKLSALRRSEKAEANMG